MPSTNHQPPTHNQLGFTLVEIITAIVIIAVIAAVALPNLRRFNQGQDLDTSTSDLVQALKLTQSNAMSNISCGLNPTDGWKIQISAGSYQVKADCKSPTGGASPSPITTIPSKNFISSRVSATHVCSTPSEGEVLEIKFQGNSVTFICSSASSPTNLTGSSYDITLKDDNNPPNTAIIKITRSGIISRQ